MLHTHYLASMSSSRNRLTLSTRTPHTFVSSEFLVTAQLSSVALFHRLGATHGHAFLLHLRA